MRIVPRFALPASCAAAGVLLAICFAGRKEPAPVGPKAPEAQQVALAEQAPQPVARRAEQADPQPSARPEREARREVSLPGRASDRTDRTGKMADRPAASSAAGNDWLGRWAKDVGRTPERRSEASISPPPSPGPASKDRTDPPQVASGRVGGEVKVRQEPPPASESLGVRVYRPRHVSPAELRLLLEPLLNQPMGLVSVSPSLEVGGPSRAEDAASGTAATVVVVRDSAAALDRIDWAVARIDVPRFQIDVQAAVVSVETGRGGLPGVDLELLQQRSHARPIPPWTAAHVPPPSALLAGSGGMRCAALEGTLASLLDTLETVGPTSLVATPRLKVADGVPAQIELAGTASGDGADAAAPAGGSPGFGRLWLRPHATADGAIHLEVAIRAPEALPAARPIAASDPGDSPSATLIIPDGATVMLLGIGGAGPAPGRSAGASAERVAWFDRLPTLRRSAPTRDEKPAHRDLLVLLTSRVVETDEGGGVPASGAYPAGDRQDAEMRRSVAPRYLRAAGNALAGGNPVQALILVETALRFDPLGRQAIDFRNRLWLLAAAKRQPRAVVPASAGVPLDAPLGQRPEVAGAREPGRKP